MAMIQRKKKICKTCQTEQYLWAYGNCQLCDNKSKSMERNIWYKPITSDSYDGSKTDASTIDEFAMWDVPKKKYKLAYSTNKAISPVSDKQKKKLAEYRIVRDAYIKDHPFCERCGTMATDLHHKRGRGEYLCAVEFFMAVCRSCHSRIETEPHWAKEQGYSLPRLEV